MGNKPWYRYYDPGVDISPSYSNIPLKDQFTEWVQKQPDHPFIYYMNEVITYKHANTIACKLANGMLNIGVKKGDRVAISLPNMPEFVFAAHACLKIGAIIVPTNPRYTKNELTHQYINSGAETVICLDKYANSNIQILNERPETLKRIILLTKDSNSLTRKPRIIDFNELVNSSCAAEPAVRVLLNDLVMLLYTGGTTGISKGCCITNTNLIAVASGRAEMCKYFTDFDNYKILCSAPLYHVYGFNTAINSNILHGGSIVLLPELTLDNILESINKYEPNVWPAIPAFIEGITKHTDLKEQKLNKIEMIGCGASPIPIATIKEFESIVGVPIIEGYGASETTAAITSNPYCKRKFGSVGIPFPNVDFKVVDIETGTKELLLGEIGEMCFKGPQVIKKYWKNPKETAIAFKDSWWHSGDIGYMDKDGFIFIVDRKKDMIICNGFKVFCNEVEEILNSHPKILEAGIIGIPDSKRGETVKAYVVVKPGEELFEGEIKEYCRLHLVAYKVPTHVEFINKLPRTPVQKLDRKTLRLFEDGDNCIA